MLEALLGNKPAIPPPSIWERLANNTYTVDSDFAAAILNGKVYFDKGNVFNVYDIASGVASGTLALREPGRIAYNNGRLLAATNKLYSTGAVPGGYSPQRLGLLSQYTVSTNAWGSDIGGIDTSAPDYKAGGIVAGIIGGAVVVVVGGTRQDATYNDYHYITNLSTGVTTRGGWTIWGATTRAGCGVAVGSYFYVLSSNTTKFRRCTAAGAWTDLAVPPKAGGACDCVTYNNKIYFYGGSFSQTIHVYDIATNTWSTLQPGGPGGTSPTIVVHGSKLYLFLGLQIWTAELNPEPA